MQASLAYGFFVKYQNLYDGMMAWQQVNDASRALDIIRSRIGDGTLKVSTPPTTTNIGRLPVEIIDLIKSHLVMNAVDGQIEKHECARCQTMHCDIFYGDGSENSYPSEGCYDCCYCTDGEAAYHTDILDVDPFLKAHGLTQALMDDRWEENSRGELSYLISVVTAGVKPSSPLKATKIKNAQTQKSEEEPEATVDCPSLSFDEGPQIVTFTPHFFSSVAKKHESRLVQLARLYRFTPSVETSPDVAFVPQKTKKKQQIGKRLLKQNYKAFVKPKWILASQTHEMY